MKRQHPDNPELFWCPKCEMYKAGGEFYKDSRECNGISCRCVECTKTHVKNWYIANTQKALQFKHNQYILHHVKINENNRKRYYKNKDRYIECNKKYALDNPEVHKKAVIKYYNSHRDILNASSIEATKNLADRYIKGKLRRDKIIVTLETIELKRQQIIMKRTLKQFKQWREENEPDHTDVSGVEHADEINNEGGL